MITISHFKYIGYSIVFLLALFIIITASIRIKMHFWHTQPVFHVYNLKYWLNPPGLINAAPPPVNKFLNLVNNTLIRVSDDAKANYGEICQFIRENYIIHDSASYKPSEQDIMAYLQCLNQPSFFNVYREPAFLPTEREIIGVTSARVLNVTLLKKKKPLNFPVYYVDNLCVKPGHRQKGIAPEMIQTFYYNVSRTNPRINAYLFKREGKLNAIVPLVYFDTYAYDLTHFRLDTILNASMEVIDVGISQLNLFIAFIKTQLPRFECVVLPDVSSVLNLIKLGKIKIYGILVQGELIAIYVFRILELYYGDKKAVECTTIVSNCKESDILITGFMMSWVKLNALTQCAIVIIEETADSNVIIKALDTKALDTKALDTKAPPLISLYFKSPTAFFLYNYATYSVPSAKTLFFY